MKHYYSILAVLVCYGCVSQQPKEVSSPPQDYSAEAGYAKARINGKTESKTNQVANPETDVKTGSKKSIIIDKTVKDKPVTIKLSEPKLTKPKVVKSKPVKPEKVVIAPQKPTKKEISTSSPAKPTESHVARISLPEASAAKPDHKAVPVKETVIDPQSDNQVLPPEQSSSTSQVDSNVAQIIIPETSHEILAEQQEIDDTLEKPENIIIDLEQLPLSFGNTWILDRNQDSISKTTRCLLNSQKKNFNDGYTDSTISLQLTSTTLLIKTNSSIDLSYPDIGIYIDQNEPFPIENLFGDSSILIKQNTQKITEQLFGADKLTIKLGFWPTWPKTETHSIDFALSDFNKAYQSFLACEKL